MKVAVVFHELDPAGGGGHTFSQALLQGVLAAEGESPHEFVFYCAGQRIAGSDPRIKWIPGGAERYRRRLLYLLRDVQDRVSMPRSRVRTWFERSLEREGAELVWFTSYYAEDCNLPFVFTLWDLAYLEHPWFPEVSRDGEWERRHHYHSRYIPKATRVIVPNEAGRDQLVRHFRTPAERVLCLNHPTPPFAREAGQRTPPELPERYGLTRPYLLYPAQFWAHKNHATLLEALSRLPGYQLACVGSDKGELAHVRSLADRLGVSERVRFVGFVPVEELVALYRSAHALVYMSLFGPENMPPLEAFALGCPVVAADIPGAREQMGDGALLVSPLDAAAVAEAVRALEQRNISDPLVERGRARASELSVERYVGEVLGFLDEFEPVVRRWSPGPSSRSSSSAESSSIRAR